MGFINKTSQVLLPNKTTIIKQGSDAHKYRIDASQSNTHLRYIRASRRPINKQIYDAYANKHEGIENDGSVVENDGGFTKLIDYHQ